jgi:hypothetical protein
MSCVICEFSMFPAASLALSTTAISKNVRSDSPRRAGEFLTTSISMGAATGRDVFLIYDPTAEKLRPGHVDLGISKERICDQGCWVLTEMGMLRHLCARGY